MSQLATSIRAMNRAEFGQLVDWAAAEGWNPGLHDADVFWATDPEAFVAAEVDGALAGGGAITSYAGQYGFMGFFIVRPEHRGRGLGNHLWHERRERLLARLAPGASIGMDGVFAMQSYYAKGGFEFSHRNLRFRGHIPASTAEVGELVSEKIVALATLPFETVAAYDRRCFPAPRPGFLRHWMTLPESLALGHVAAGRLQGYGVVRRCRSGCKIGPLFADDAVVAESLFTALSRFAAGGEVFLDVPEANAPAMQLACRHGMTEVFGCARMYLGRVPEIAHERVFGVTTFELG